MENLTIEELEKKILEASDPLEWIDASNELAWRINNEDTLRSLAITQKTLKKALELNYKRGIAKAKLVTGYCNLLLLNLNESHDDGKEALDIFRELDEGKGIAQSLNLLGAYFFRISDFEKAVTNLLECLEKSEQIGFKQGIASASGNLGNIYAGLDELDKAIKYYEDIHKIYKELNDKARQAASLSNMGSIHYQKKNYQTAIEFFMQSIELSKEISPESPAILSDYGRIADAYLELKNYAEAKKYGLMSLEANKEGLYKHGYVRSLHILGDIALIENDLDQAFKYYTTALKESNVKFYYVLPGLFKGMANLYTKKNDYKNALEFYIKYHEAIEKRHETKSDKKLKSVELKHITKLAEIEKNKNQELQIANEKLKEKNLLIEAQKEKMIESITYAQRIQQSVFPDKNEIKKILPDSFIYYQPKDIVSGDFYWFSHVDHKIIISAIDCTGHGIPGAFMSMIGNTILNQIVNEKQETSPAKILKQMNIGIFSALKQEKGDISSQDGMDMSLCVIDKINNELHFAGAVNPIYIIHDGKLEILKADGYSIGGTLLKNESIQDRKFTSHIIKIKKGMCIYLFTDGYSDQFGGENRKKIGSQRFREILLQNHNLPMEKQRQILVREFNQWQRDNAQIDDVLVIGIRL